MNKHQSPKSQNHQKSVKIENFIKMRKKNNVNLHQIILKIHSFFYESPITIFVDDLLLNYYLFFYFLSFNYLLLPLQSEIERNFLLMAFALSGYFLLSLIHQ